MAQTTSEVWDSHWSATQRSVKKEVVEISSRIIPPSKCTGAKACV